MPPRLAVLGAQAFLEDDDQVERARGLAAGRLAMQAGMARVGHGGWGRPARASAAVHVVVVHVAIDGKANYRFHTVVSIERWQRVQGQSVRHAIGTVGDRRGVDQAVAERAADRQDRTARIARL